MKIVITVLTMILLSALGHAQQLKDAQRRMPIYRLLDSFMESIIKKDTSTFTSLFIDKAAWIKMEQIYKKPFNN